MKIKFYVKVSSPEKGVHSCVPIKASRELEADVFRDFISGMNTGLLNNFISGMGSYVSYDYTGFKFEIYCHRADRLFDVEQDASECDLFITCSYNLIVMNPKIIYDFIDFCELFYMTESEFNESGKDKSVLTNYNFNGECYKAVCSLHKSINTELDNYKKYLVENNSIDEIFFESERISFYKDFADEIANLENSLQTYGERSIPLTIGESLFTADDIMRIVDNYGLNIMENAYTFSWGTFRVDLSYVFNKLLEDV